MRLFFTSYAMLAMAFAMAVGPAPSFAQTTDPASLAATPLLPPKAKPGECYTRVYVPASYETKTEQVLKKEQAEKIEVSPPKFETVKEEVLIKEPTEKIEAIPAVFKEVDEQVLIKPESEELVVVPAEYQEVEEQVLVRAGYSTWQTDCGPVEKLAQTTGETLCLVEVPPEYKTVTKRVLKAPARTEKVKKPAEYKTVKKQVVETPPTTKTTKIPAEYTTVQVQRLVEPAKEVRTPIPEEYEAIAKTVKTGDARVEWRQILCSANITTDMVRRVQEALKDKGLYRGPIDGSIGPGTMAALVNFQKSKGLPTGQLTTETIDALGLN
jgi:hypothetical protein